MTASETHYGLGHTPWPALDVMAGSTMQTNTDTQSRRRAVDSTPVEKKSGSRLLPAIPFQLGYR